MRLKFGIPFLMGMLEVYSLYSIAGFLIVGFGGGNSLNEPFASQIESIKLDFTWAFNPDERTKPLYEQYIKTVTSDEFKKDYPNDRIIPYEEYRKMYIEERQYRVVRAYFHFIWPIVLLFFIFLPRPRGFRVNRKKRVNLLANHFRQVMPSPLYRNKVTR